MQTADSPSPSPADSPQIPFVKPLEPGFDSQHPPEQGIIDACVHCGFCLTTCPSYRVIGKEMDSPRGRIYLMDAINKGDVPFS
ncbi:MAG: 4Fe-4S dicluster domain-containing protein, partial [Cyanobacteria bacterium P01_D01_bin.6]